MAEVKTPLVFRKEWVEQVKEIIGQEKSVANAGKIPRVVTSLLEAKAEAYIPHFVSLGPYHHWKLEKKIGASSSSAGKSYEYSDLKMSIGEAYKVQEVATISQKLQNGDKSFDDIIGKIKGMRQEIEDFYGWPISTDGEYPKHFALKMAIDSSFLLRFLFNHLILESDDMRYLNRLQVCIKCDILKLENQIPLPVLRNVFDIGIRALYDAEDNAKKALYDAEDNGKKALYGATPEDFSKLLQETCNKFSPFDEFSTQCYGTYQINGQPHLLGCMHAFVWPIMNIKQPQEDASSSAKLTCLLQIVRCYSYFQKQGICGQSVSMLFEALAVTILSNFLGKRRRRDFLKPHNARELIKGGIKLKSSEFPTFGIRFDENSGTLYLPRITISEMQTEVFFRNLLALEFNDADRGDYVTRYVGFMHFLIATPDDVRVLRKSDIIDRRSPMLSDEDIARMWKNMCHPFFTGHLEPSDQLLKALTDVLDRKYYMSLVRKALWKVYWDNLSNPGKGVAMVVGGLILAMTFAQTYFAWWDWSHTYHKH